MDPLITAQHQIRQNADELQDFLRDLNQWKDEMSKKETEIGTLAPIEERLPPIRGSKDGKTQIDVVGKNKKNKAKEKEPRVAIEEPKAKRISSYDYNSWDKFDADKACEVLDKEEENKESDEDDDDEELSEEEDYELIRRREEASEEKEKGNDFFRLGKIDQAIECYTRGILCDPSNAFLPANRALALLKKEMYSAAEQDCNLALEIDPDYVKAIQRRGIARAALKKFDLAKEDFRRVLQLEPGNKQAYDELIKLKDIEVSETRKTKEEKPELKIEAKTTTPSRRVQIEEINSETEDKNIVKPINKPPHLRSKKPLKRMNITEVTSRDCKKETPVKMETESDLDMGSKVKEICLPGCPQTNYQFQTSWRTLKNYPDMKYLYLKQIPYERFNALFEFLENDLLAEMLNVMNDFYVRNGADVYMPLKYLSELKRFPILCMFFSAHDKEVLCNLFQYIKSDTKSGEDVDTLANSYQIKL